MSTAGVDRYEEMWTSVNNVNGQECNSIPRHLITFLLHTQARTPTPTHANIHTHLTLHQSLDAGVLRRQHSVRLLQIALRQHH